jgi:hypothetical protein
LRENEVLKRPKPSQSGPIKLEVTSAAQTDDLMRGKHSRPKPMFSGPCTVLSNDFTFKRQEDRDATAEAYQITTANGKASKPERILSAPTVGDNSKAKQDLKSVKT